MSESWIGTD